MDKDYIVYSTKVGRINPEKKPSLPSNARAQKNGDTIYILYQKQGRKGSGVCIITNLDADALSLQDLATELKRKCGCGGTVKNDTIEIQGDKRTLLKTLLEAKQYKVKLSGG